MSEEEKRPSFLDDILGSRPTKPAALHIAGDARPASIAANMDGNLTQKISKVVHYIFKITHSPDHWGQLLPADGASGLACKVEVVSSPEGVTAKIPVLFRAADGQVVLIHEGNLPTVTPAPDADNELGAETETVKPKTRKSSSAKTAPAERLPLNGDDTLYYNTKLLVNKLNEVVKGAGLMNVSFHMHGSRITNVDTISVNAPNERSLILALHSMAEVMASEAKVASPSEAMGTITGMGGPVVG